MEIHKKIIYKNKEFRIYKWENKPFKDFPMPEGFDWCEYNDFVELINDKKIKLGIFPIEYFVKNQFKSNIKKGWELSGLFLGRDLALDSDYVNLADTDSGGRVIVSKTIGKKDRFDAVKTGALGFSRGWDAAEERLRKIINKKDKITLELWEYDNYVICINGKPMGSSLRKSIGEEILIILKEMQRENGS